MKFDLTMPQINTAMIKYNFLPTRLWVEFYFYNLMFKQVYVGKIPENFINCI